jgi:hypothetical protein
MKRLGILLAVLSALLLPRASWSQSSSDALTESQIRELIRKSADNDVENTKRQRDYTYVQRNEQRSLDGRRRVKSTESKTYEIMVLSGEPVQKLIAKDDKPLSDKEGRKEDEKIQKLIAKYEKENESQRKKRIAKDEKTAEEDRQFVREIADAFKFRLAPMETIDGRVNYVIDAEPIPGYKPKLKDASILPKLRFRLWLDKADAQWTKLDVECIDTISWGLFLARFHKGSTMHLEQTRVNDEVWLPKRFSLKLDARVVLFKGLNMEIDVTFRDYRKFVAATTIKPLGELPDGR